MHNRKSAAGPLLKITTERLQEVKKSLPNATMTEYFSVEGATRMQKWLDATKDMIKKQKCVALSRALLSWHCDNSGTNNLSESCRFDKDVKVFKHEYLDKRLAPKFGNVFKANCQNTIAEKIDGNETAITLESILTECIKFEWNQIDPKLVPHVIIEMWVRLDKVSKIQKLLQSLNQPSISSVGKK